MQAYRRKEAHNERKLGREKAQRRLNKGRERLLVHQNRDTSSSQELIVLFHADLLLRRRQSSTHRPAGNEVLNAVELVL